VKGVDGGERVAMLVYEGEDVRHSDSGIPAQKFGDSDSMRLSARISLSVDSIKEHESQKFAQ
jgi:hypothetical protein